MVFFPLIIDKRILNIALLGDCSEGCALANVVRVKQEGVVKNIAINAKPNFLAKFR